MSKTKTVFSTAIFLFVAAGILAAATPPKSASPLPPIVLPRIGGPVTLDGLSEEAAWRDIRPIGEIVQFSPTNGLPPSERTEVLIAHDDKNLYVAGRLFDSEPQRIRANSKQRDSGDGSSDWFGILLDTFNDKDVMLGFFTTPAGLRWDAVIPNDARNRPTHYNSSWNTFWDVSVRRNGEGWFAEFRIPLGSLRFQTVDGRVIMGMITWRSVARRNEWSSFPAIPPDWGFVGLFKASLAREVALDGVTPKTPVYLTPFALFGMDQAPAAAGAASEGVGQNHVVKEIGFDAKYGVTNNLTLDLTINTDFAQVEADDLQINLTRFSLYYPEKRLFFQERGSIFDFNFEAPESNTLFYSRRIGLHDGRRVPIYGGARLVGRIGPWDLGFLDMQTAAIEGLPSENFGVLRFRRQVFNPHSYVGGIVTSRLGREGAANLAYGLDGVFRVFGDDYLTFRWAQAFADLRTARPLSLDTSRFFLDWTRRSLNGFGYSAVLSRAGRDYEPGLGFETRRDFTRVLGSAWFGWFPSGRSFLYSQEISLTGRLYIRNVDQAPESWSVIPCWEVATKKGFSLQVLPGFNFENVSAGFSLGGGAGVPSGLYRFGDIGVTIGTPSSRPFFGSVALTGGSFYDGTKFTAQTNLRWGVSADLQLTASHQMNRVEFPSRGQRFTSHIARLRALYMLSIAFSAEAYIQLDSLANSAVANLRLRYNPREGNDLYLVFNQQLHTQRFQNGVERSLSAGRAIMVKYSYTFNL